MPYALRAEGVGDWFYTVWWAYQSPNFALVRGRYTVSLGYYLRFQGNEFGRRLRQLGVPTSLVDGWQTQWALMTADAEEEDANPLEVCTQHVRLLTTAQELVRVHGH